MTLADLCTALLERESVTYSFREPTGKASRRAGENVTREELTRAARRLGTFVRADLQRETKCNYEAARHWCDKNEGVLIERVGRRLCNGGIATVWRWL